jgi:hypothetical protein
MPPFLRSHYTVIITLIVVMTISFVSFRQRMPLFSLLVDTEVSERIKFGTVASCTDDNEALVAIAKQSGIPLDKAGDCVTLALMGACVHSKYGSKMRALCVCSCGREDVINNADDASLMSVFPSWFFSSSFFHWF